MKKSLIACTGLLVVLLLLCVASAAADAQSIEEYRQQGYTIADLADTIYDSEGSVVLNKDVTYLRETEKDGISRNGNSFSLASGKYQKTAAPDGQQTKYCILSGGRLFFGDRNGSSGSETIILDNLHELNPEEIFLGGDKPRDQMMLQAVVGQAAEGADPEKTKEELSRDLTAKLADLGAPITYIFFNVNQDFEVNIDFIEDVLPFYAKGNFTLYGEYRYDNPGMFEYSMHDIHMYVDLNVTDIGIKSDEVVTDTYERAIITYEDWLDLATVKATLRDFQGEVAWYMHGHFGFKIHFETFYGPVATDDWYCKLDDDNMFDMGIAHVKGKGDLEIGITVGPSVTVDMVITHTGLGGKMDFGFAMTNIGSPDRFKPADTKDQWHICDECVQEEIRSFAGPSYVYLDLPFDNKYDLEWDFSDRVYSDPIKTFYFSNTFDECEDGDCPHWAWHTQTEVCDEEYNLLQNVDVSYSEVPAHCNPYASGTTGADGIVDLYMPPGTYEIEAKAVSPLDPTWVISKSLQYTKYDADTTGAQIKLPIPKSHVYFKNPQSGEATKWPEDITFSIFFSKDVQLPDAIPELAGRQFTGWNTKEDGSGTSYAPGTKLSLEEDLTLWAQWQVAGDSWYVVYNANGGTKVPDPQIVPKGQDAVLTTELPEGGKMIFKGWTPDKQHPEQVYQPGDTLKYDSGKSYVVLYALWDLSPVPEPIHVSFSANGLEDAVLPADVWFEQGSWLQLEPAFAPVGSAQTFIGWSEDPGAKEPEYLAGRSYYFFRDTQLFAIWDNLDTLTLTFLDSLPDASSGIPNPITILPSMSTYVHIPDQIPQKSGRIFTGWNTRKDGSGTRYAPGSVITLRKSTVLWAQWEVPVNSWYVIFDANGGTKAPGAQIVPQGQDAVLTKELPENGNLTFMGWATDPNAVTAEYQPGDTLKYDSGKNYVVLYALWELDPAGHPVGITFRANGGRPDTVPDSISVPKSAWFLLPESEPAWDPQHYFLGWSDDPEAADAKWKAGGAAVFDQDTVLYAVWDPRYKVISGANSVWYKKSTGSLRFIADGDIKYFVELRIDGKRFTKGVEISSGSTVADIKPWALETLSVGTHTITFRYEDGEASALFFIRKTPPPTGDPSDPALWLFLVILGIAGIALAGVRAYTAGKKK